MAECSLPREGMPSPSRAEIYDPVTGTWAATGSMSRPRREHALGEARIYDPASSTWSATGRLNAEGLASTKVIWCHFLARTI
jgi:hypothetical protein